MDLYKDTAQGAENTLFEAPNDQIFPNTQVFKMDFCTPLYSLFGQFGAALKIIYVPSDISGELWSCRKFEGAFCLIRKCQLS